MTELSELIANAKADLDALKADPNLALLHEHGWKYIPSDQSKTGELLFPLALTEGKFPACGLYDYLEWIVVDMGNNNAPGSPTDPYAAIGTSREAVAELTAPLYRRVAELILMNFDRNIPGWEDRLLFGQRININQQPYGKFAFQVPSLENIIARHGGAENLGVDPVRVKAATDAAIHAQFERTIRITTTLDTMGMAISEVVVGKGITDPEILHHSHDGYLDPRSKDTSSCQFVPLAKLAQLVGGYENVPEEFKSIVNEESVARFVAATIEDQRYIEVANNILFQERCAENYKEDMRRGMDNPVSVDRGALVGYQHRLTGERHPGLLEKIEEMGGFAVFEKFVPGVEARMKALVEISVDLGVAWPLGASAPKPELVQGADKAKAPKKKTGGDLTM